MTAPTPKTFDWLAPPEIEPIPAEGLAWLQQSARVHGATYSQVLLHVLERIELLDKDSIEQSKSNSFCFEAVIKRLEKLEAAQQHDTLLIGGPQDKPTPAVVPAGGLVERMAAVIAGAGDPDLWHDEARVAIREVAAWLDQQGQHGCSLLLREDADRG